MLRFNHLSLDIDIINPTMTFSHNVLPGEVLHVKGISGSGKTTLLKTIAKLRPLKSGSIYFKEKNSIKFTSMEWRKSVHYVSQQPVFFSGTVYDNLNMPFHLKLNKTSKYISQYEIENLLEQFLLPRVFYKKNAKQLSIGEALRVNLIRSIIFSPSVLLLDEPLASLDANARISVLDFLSSWIKKKEKALIIVSHDMPLSNLKINASIVMDTSIKNVTIS